MKKLKIVDFISCTIHVYFFHQSILRFWLDVGVDGFRVNSARYLVEDFEQRPENVVDPIAPECSGPVSHV